MNFHKWKDLFRFHFFTNKKYYYLLIIFVVNHLISNVFVWGLEQQIVLADFATQLINQINLKQYVTQLNLSKGIWKERKTRLPSSFSTIYLATLSAYRILRSIVVSGIYNSKFLRNLFIEYSHFHN